MRKLSKRQCESMTAKGADQCLRVAKYLSSTYLNQPQPLLAGCPQGLTTSPEFIAKQSVRMMTDRYFECLLTLGHLWELDKLTA